MEKIALEDWDPLIAKDFSEELIGAAKKREIKNILKSYTGWYDPFCELIQNALDAVDQRKEKEGKVSNYTPQLWIKIDLRENLICVTDNGVGFTESEFKNFLRPNVAFKTGPQRRGDKGVGATYLAYGFNYLQIGTKTHDFTYVGTIKDGREWVEDEQNIKTRPKVQKSDRIHEAFDNIDNGSTFCLKLVGDFIRPNNLRWVGADDADKWDVVLRAKTPLGGIYLDCEPTTAKCNLTIIDENGKLTEKVISNCEYLYPHKVVFACINLKEILKKQQELISKGKDGSRLPARFFKLNGIYSTWTHDELISKSGVLRPKLEEEEKKLLEKYKVSVYGFFCYSTGVWDEYNDNTVRLRKGGRILRGGLQLATNGMPQGQLIVIPLTANIGYQQTSHVIVHFAAADPDLGRKGFQPELQKLAEDISTSAVGVFKNWRKLLKKETGAPPDIIEDKKIDDWIKIQEEHEKKEPLIIKHKGVFLPTEEISITSKPLVEQDVVALFNQLLAGGVIRGLRIMATSEHEKYDGVYRAYLKKPFEHHIFDVKTNPLGIDRKAISEEFVSKPYILEYKYSFDALLAEIEKGEKTEKNIDLVVGWEMGNDWKKRYEITPLLHFSNLHHRTFHGVTHEIKNATTGDHVFYGIVLSELIDYINDPEGVQEFQKKKYMEE